MFDNNYEEYYEVKLDSLSSAFNLGWEKPYYESAIEQDKAVDEQIRFLKMDINRYLTLILQRTPDDFTIDYICERYIETL